jgi:hypothetical protein
MGQIVATVSEELVDPIKMSDSIVFIKYGPIRTLIRESDRIRIDFPHFFIVGTKNRCIQRIIIGCILHF